MGYLGWEDNGQLGSHPEDINHISAKATLALVGRPLGRVGVGMWGQGAAHLEVSILETMVPGGKVLGVSVLLMAMVMRQEDRGPLWTSLVMSASKGRWPPSCCATWTPFTHCRHREIWGGDSRPEHEEGVLPSETLPHREVSCQLPPTSSA